MLKIYEFQEEGYKPLLNTNEWTVACLNFLEDARANNVTLLERHTLTKEVFIPVMGEMELIILNNSLRLEFVKMQIGKMYCVDKNVWHGLVMTEDAQCFIVKDADPVRGKDVEHRRLTHGEREEILRYYSVGSE